MQTWEKATSRFLCAATLSPYSSDASQEVTVLGQVVDAFGSDFFVVTLNGGSHVLAQAFFNYPGNGYLQKLVQKTTFDIRLFRRFLQWTSFSQFGSLNPFWMTAFVVKSLKVAENCDWRVSRPALWRAVITNHLSKPQLVEVVANVGGGWNISYFKETGRRDNGDSPMVKWSTQRKRHQRLIVRCLERGHCQKKQCPTQGPDLNSS